MLDFLCSESFRASSTNLSSFVPQMKVNVVINYLMNVKFVTVMFYMDFWGLVNKEGH